MHFGIHHKIKILWSFFQNKAFVALTSQFSLYFCHKDERAKPGIPVTNFSHPQNQLSLGSVLFLLFVPSSTTTYISLSLSLSLLLKSSSAMSFS